MGFVSEVKDTTTGPHAIGGIYLIIIGLALSDILPTISDAAFFNRQKTLRDEWKKGNITPSQYWRSEAVAYYLYNFIYWIIIGVIVVVFGKTAKTKAYILGALVGGGAVIAVIAKNIKQDNADLAQQLKDELALEALKNQNVVK